jgi:hypothetical protein
MGDSLITKMCGHLNLPTECAKEGLDLHRELKAMNTTGLGMNEGMEAVICLHLVAESKGCKVDINLCMKLAGKTKPVYHNTFKNVQKRLGIVDTLTLQEIGVQLGMPPGLLTQAREVLEAYKKQFQSNQISDIDFEKAVYLCSAIHAVAKHNKHKVDTTKLVEIAKSTKKEVTGKSDEMSKVLDQMTTKSSTGRLPLKILQEDESLDNTKEGEAAKRKHEEENDLDEAEDFKAWKQAILRRAVDSGFKQYQQFIEY